MIESVENCETILRKEREYNEQHEIFSSENAVIDRMLNRSVELTEAYAELHMKLADQPRALRVFLGTVITTAAFWNPEKIGEARNGRARLNKVNSRIASKAEELSKLLKERSKLHNESGFSDDTLYHIIDVIENAGANHHLFQSWVKKDLNALPRQFSLKYWPALHECLAALARDAEKAELKASDSITAAATEANRASQADFFKALYEAIDENRTSSGGLLPNQLKLTDSTIASLANCALDIAPDELADGAYVKRLRQRERNRRNRRTR